MREQESFRQALESVDFFTQLIEEDLPDMPPTQSVRQKALERSLTYYQGFIDQRGDDRSLHAELTASRERVSKFLAELAEMEGFRPVWLLNNPNVVSDLGVDPEKRREIQRVFYAFEERQHELSRTARALGREQWRRQRADLAAAHQKEVLALLKPAQAHRLKQIHYQVGGPMAFREPEVVKALGLNPQQQAKIGALQVGGFGDHCEPGPPRGDDRTKPDPIRPDLLAQILTELTPAQQSKWMELTGPPFKGFGRGGPGRPGFGRPGAFGHRGGFGPPPGGGFGP